jgi:hypothetical protein
MSDATGPFSSGDGRIPPEVPGFDLIRPIGKGGFGEVWLAANRATGRLRAVKIIAATRSGALDLAGREITSIIRLEANLHRQHPNLVHIHHVGKSPGHVFFVMDLAIVVCDGTTPDNRKLATEIEELVVGVGNAREDPPHVISAGPDALPHFQPKARPPAGHSFFETSTAKAK